MTQYSRGLERAAGGAQKLAKALRHELRNVVNAWHEAAGDIYDIPASLEGFGELIDRVERRWRLDLCPEFLHAGDCPKFIHAEGVCYLHEPDDDSPYEIDGVMFCGRCHGWLSIAEKE